MVQDNDTYQLSTVRRCEEFRLASVSDLLPLHTLYQASSSLALLKAVTLSTDMVRKLRGIMIANTYLKVNSILIYLTVIFVIQLGILEHQLNVSHEMVDRVVFLPLQFFL